MFRSLSFELSGLPFTLSQTTALRRIQPSAWNRKATRQGMPTRFLSLYVSPMFSQKEPVGLSTRRRSDSSSYSRSTNSSGALSSPSDEPPSYRRTAQYGGDVIAQSTAASG